MKKIAIVLNDAIIGGVETAFSDMMNAFDFSQYDITLFTNIEGNSIIHHLPKSIRIVDLNSFSPYLLLKNHFRSFQLFRAAKDLFCLLQNRIGKNEFRKIKRIAMLRKLSDENFDAAIAYKQTIAMANVLYSLNAEKKCVWVHGALLNEKGIDTDYLKCFDRFDKIFCVSETVLQTVDRLRGKDDGKTELFHNLIDPEKIRRLSEAYSPDYPENKTILCTVGRLGPEKGQKMIPEISSLLLADGYDFQWFVVGDGPEKELLTNEIRKYRVENSVILTGAKQNPYPYMKHCTIYVQTSVAEGWGLTVQEAKILRKPIVTTGLPVFSEQISHLNNGYLAEGTSAHDLYQGIKWLIDSKEARSAFSDCLKSSVDTCNDLSKLYAFLNG